MARILVVGDQMSTRESIAETLRRGSNDAVDTAGFERVGHGALGASAPFDTVIVHTSAARRCREAVRLIKATWPQAELIVVGESRELTEATEAVKHGASEYVVMPLDPVLLRRRIRAATFETRDQPREPASCADPEDIPVVDALTRAAFAKADRAAAVSSAVLITGESGTGKEVVARRIHRQSMRRAAKFVPVNCGCLTETLIESELFGYRKGAFTGAVSNVKGLVEEADGGTLFLDEIGDMPLAMQVRLLRFLDSGEVRSVGGTSVRHVDVRVIAATNRCLEAEIVAKRFRADLFFRLNVVSLELPPLRNRQADLHMLIDFHLRRTAARLRLPIATISNEARSMLLTHGWPGNFRELQNAIEQALVQCSNGVIKVDDLPQSVRGRDPIAGSVLQVTDEQELLAALSRNRGNHVQTAAELGISRTTLWRRLRQIRADSFVTRRAETSN